MPSPVAILLLTWMACHQAPSSGAALDTSHQLQACPRSSGSPHSSMGSLRPRPWSSPCMRVSHPCKDWLDGLHAMQQAASHSRSGPWHPCPRLWPRPCLRMSHPCMDGQAAIWTAAQGHGIEFQIYWNHKGPLQTLVPGVGDKEVGGYKLYKMRNKERMGQLSTKMVSVGVHPNHYFVHDLGHVLHNDIPSPLLRVSVPCVLQESGRDTQPRRCDQGLEGVDRPV
mmetsp:Transcript_29370/g.86840  ORF Transcript_29370/g.86840 Transcript_29370/m.86840 type:complete len:225 (+) Transcript_29370:2743-3417(+)